MYRRCTDTPWSLITLDWGWKMEKREIKKFINNVQDHEDLEHYVDKQKHPSKSLSNTYSTYCMSTSTTDPVHRAKHCPKLKDIISRYSCWFGILHLIIFSALPPPPPLGHAIYYSRRQGLYYPLWGNCPCRKSRGNNPNNRHTKYTQYKKKRWSWGLMKSNSWSNSLKAAPCVSVMYLSRPPCPKRLLS